MAKYKKAETIGYGAHGGVYKGSDPVTNETVIVKELWFLNEREGVPSAAIKEISLLKEMKHMNIVRLLDVVNAVDEKSVYLVYEDMDSDLEKFMNDCPEIAKDPNFIKPSKLPHTRSAKKRFLQQILCGLAYYHSRNILHQDLKPQNLWIDHINHILKLADFGWARAFGDRFIKDGNVDVTRWYKAPELLLCCPQHSTPIDMWSVGCIFAEMMTQQPLFTGDSDEHVLSKIFSIMGTPNEETWPGVTTSCPLVHNHAKGDPKDLLVAVPNLETLEPAGIDLLTKMLCVNPSGRITAHDALKHAYFENFEFEV